VNKDSAEQQTNLTRQVAAFICSAQPRDLPEEVVALGKKSILDSLGLALSGEATDCGALVQGHLRDLHLGAGPSTMIGTALKVAPRFAAFANAVAIHADDYDDTQLAVGADRVYGLLTHPSAPALPAALAIAELVKADGRTAMLAYHLGVEVECKIAEAINPRHYQSGFHATGTCGTFGAAAASAKLLGLGVDATARALSIAGSQSAGLRENFGTMTKPFHAGRASESGVVAAQFAFRGWTATDRILEAPRGFFSAAGGGYDAEAIAGKLGAPWTIADPGVSIKPHPSGSLTHPAMTEMLRLINAHRIDARDVVRVRVGTNHNMPNALIHHRPVNELQAKFSMEFCMAILLLDGRAGLGEFTDATVMRPDVRDMIEKIDFGVDADAEAAGYHKMTSIIRIELSGGRVVSGRADFGKGSPADPMSYDEVAAKFRENAAYARFPSSQAESVVDMVRELESLPSIDRLMAALTRAAT
jgi:2-methylcitrate dehydratase PrpD